MSAFERAEFGPVHELVAGPQQIGAFTVTTRAQLRHWAPTAGLRIGDDLGLITDTAFLSDQRTVLDDARVVAPHSRLGEDAQVLE